MVISGDVVTSLGGRDAAFDLYSKGSLSYYFFAINLDVNRCTVGLPTNALNL